MNREDYIYSYIRMNTEVLCINNIKRRNPASTMIVYRNLHPEKRTPAFFLNNIYKGNIVGYLYWGKVLCSRTLTRAFKGEYYSGGIFEDRFIIISGAVYDTITNDFIILFTKDISDFIISKNPIHIKYTLEVSKIVLSPEFAKEFKSLVNLYKRLLREIKGLDIDVIYTKAIKGLPLPETKKVPTCKLELLKYCTNFVDAPISSEENELMEYLKKQLQLAISFAGITESAAFIEES